MEQAKASQLSPALVAEAGPRPELIEGSDLDHLITCTAAIAATHQDWFRLRQLFLATFMAERMTVDYPELATKRHWDS